jgi:hypothetical protein
MNRSTVSSKADYWQRILDEQRLSKLSVAAFCAQNSISVPSSYQWRCHWAILKGPLMGAYLVQNP